jgi:RHS repeat-associated protein
MWGGGGGGSGGGAAQVGGGAGAYVHSAGVGVTPGNNYTVTIGGGGSGGVGGGAAGTGGTGYKSGGNGSSDTNGRGGGGGGSSAFTNDGTIIIASGGGGGGYKSDATGATGSSGGKGDDGNVAGTNFAGGGGGSGTNGANASGNTGGAGGTGGTTQTGTNGGGLGSGGGGSSAGSSGNGVNASGNTGGSGSGGATHGTAGSGTDSGGGGNGTLSGTGETGGAPGAGGGGTGGVSNTAGTGGAGKVILTYSGSGTTVSTSTIKDALYDDTVVDQNSNKVRETRHYYDGLALGSVSLENETKTENWISGTSSPTYASTTRTYDGTYGLVTQSRDADGNLSTSTLDANNLYVATTTNALLKATGYAYDYSTGKVKTTFDPNNRLLVTAYDAVGRPLMVSEPDPSGGLTVTKTTYAYSDSSTPGSTYITQTDYLSSATSTQTYSYVDGLGRNLQVRKQAKGNNNYSVKDWTYNNVGLLKSESLLYLASSSARSSATTTSKLFTNHTYDGLQRKTTTVNSVGTTSNAYDRWTITTTDPNGNFKDYTKDAYDNLATVAEYSATSSATTTYAWDLNKSLTKITDALGNIRNFTYDGLGRRLKAEDLHAVAAGTFGSTTYAYDPAGNVTQQIDAKNQTVNSTYDVLNRKLTEDYTGQAGTEVTNTYDSCTNGIGRLCVASSTGAKVTNAYDPDGNISNATTTVSGTNYGMSYTYDRQGNLTNVVYPNNAQVNYNLNTAGLTDMIAYKASGGSFANIVNDFEYAPDARVSQQFNNNTTNTTFSYDPNAQYRLTRILSCGSQCLTPGSQTTQTFTSSGTFTAPAGITLVTVDAWGGGGGGSGGGAAQVGGGAGAYVHSAGVGVTPGNNYTVTIGAGGGGGIGNGAVGAGGSGYKTGGNGSSDTNGRGGGGGGSSAFTNDGTIIIASGGGGGGYKSDATGATGSSGGKGDDGANSAGANFAGGGGGSNTNGSNAAGTTGGAGGTGGTTQTGTNGGGLGAGGAGSSAGASGNGNNASGNNGGAGSGGAAHGTAGSGRDSGGGGNGPLSSNGENGGTPGAGGGGTGGASATAGTGGAGEVVVTYGSSTVATGSTLQDLNYTYDSDGNIIALKSVGSSTASTTLHFAYDTLNRLTYAYGNSGTGITATPHNYWGMNGTSSDSVGGDNGFDTAISYGTTTGKILQGAAFNGSTSKINVGNVASGTVNLSVGAWVKTSSAGTGWIMGQTDVGTVTGWWSFRVSNGNVDMFTDDQSGGGTGSTIGGKINVADGNWHYVGFSQNGTTYTIYVDGVLDVQKKVGTAVSYDPTIGAGIGYNRRGNDTYFTGDIDELAVWNSTLSQNDFLTLYNVGLGYGYPWGTSTLATSTYNFQSYTYDALGNFTSKASNKYTYGGTGYANPDAVTQIANGVSTTTLAYDNNGNLTSAGTSTFIWDYNNRMTQAVTQGSTSTYAYDYAGNRVSQTVGSNTTIYPNKFYSITSSTNGATTTATTTVYVWNGDTLIATIDQVTVNGANSGSSTTRYIHPDHLGSTNVVSDENGSVVQDVEYYPYGETRLNQPTYPTNEQRQYIAQFMDGNSLVYLNARYYDSSRGQFMSEDPVFLAVGNGA